MTAKPVWTTVGTNFYSAILGYGQRMSNGNTLIAWGTPLVAQELDPNLNVLWQISSKVQDHSAFLPGYYRAYRLGSLYSYQPP